jgi:hypothetical protein
MLLTIALFLAGWFVLSIVSGIAVGASIKRLDTPPPSPQGWRVVSTRANRGVPVLMLARVAPSPPPHRRTARPS